MFSSRSRVLDRTKRSLSFLRKATENEFLLSHRRQGRKAFFVKVRNPEKTNSWITGVTILELVESLGRGYRSKRPIICFGEVIQPTVFSYGLAAAKGVASVQSLPFQVVCATVS